MLADKLPGQDLDRGNTAEALVWKGFEALAYSAPEDAAAYGRVAAARLQQQWGTARDKRLTMHQWLQLCAALCDIANADDLGFVVERIAAANSALPSPEHLYSVLARTGLLPRVDCPDNQGVTSAGNPGSPVGGDATAESAMPTRFWKYVAALRSNLQTPRIGSYPGLRSAPWHDPQQFRLVHDLESMAGEIAAEARALTGAGFQNEPPGSLVPSGRWSYLVLYVEGQKDSINCALCPRTAAVIDANRAALSFGGIVYFSVLERDTYVAPHEGPTNMRLRCHLGIDVPEGSGLRVGGMTRKWEEGRCLVFDDSFTHEVWNRGSRRRLVLVVDIWHPDLTGDEVALLNAMKLPAISGTADCVSKST
jgi:aspartyl/asparaginyl beta-hydroxylase